MSTYPTTHKPSADLSARDHDVVVTANGHERVQFDRVLAVEQVGPVVLKITTERTFMEAGARFSTEPVPAFFYCGTGSSQDVLVPVS